MASKPQQPPCQICGTSDILRRDESGALLLVAGGTLCNNCSLLLKTHTSPMPSFAGVGNTVVTTSISNLIDALDTSLTILLSYLEISRTGLSIKSLLSARQRLEITKSNLRRRTARYIDDIYMARRTIDYCQNLNSLLGKAISNVKTTGTQRYQELDITGENIQMEDLMRTLLSSVDKLNDLVTSRAMIKIPREATAIDTTIEATQKLPKRLAQTDVEQDELGKYKYITEISNVWDDEYSDLDKNSTQNEPGGGSDRSSVSSSSHNEVLGENWSQIPSPDGQLEAPGARQSLYALEALKKTGGYDPLPVLKPQPQDHETSPVPDPQAPILSYRVPNTEDAFSYLEKIRASTAQDPNIYSQFLGIMKDFKGQLVDTAGTIKRIVTLFPNNPDLIEGFNIWLPPGYNLRYLSDLSDPSFNNIRITTPQGTTLAALGRHADLGADEVLQSALIKRRAALGKRKVALEKSEVALQNYLKERSSIYEVQQLQNNPKVELDINDMIDYTNKVKVRFSSQPEVYNNFVRLLDAYHEKNLSIVEVYGKVAELFSFEPDLVEDFRSSLQKWLQPRDTTNNTGHKLPGLSEGLAQSTSDISFYGTLLREIKSNLGFLDLELPLAPPAIDSQSEWKAVASDVLPYIDAPEATDSGYASMKHRSYEAQNTQADICERLSMSKHSPAVEEALDLDDTQTVYSDTSTVTTLAKGNYISELADALFREACMDQPDIMALERVFEGLPELLKAFALKVGYNAPSQMHRDVMVFIHKNRGDVTEYFRGRCSRDERDGLLEVQATDPDNMALGEKMDLWLSKSEHFPPPEQDLFEENQREDIDGTSENEQGDIDGMTENKQEDIDHLTLAYRDFIFRSPAFEWLVGSLRRDVLLTPIEPNYMGTIASTIIESLPSSHTVSKKKSAEAFRVVLTMDWEPLAFFNEQEYKDEAGEVIERAITLTGSAKDAQALTCAEYLYQTWPQTGKRIAQLIKDVVTGKPETPHNCILPDNTEVTVSLWGSLGLVVEAFGTGHSVAEVGQQVAWVCAALRSSSRRVGIVTCIPTICDIRALDPQKVRSTTPSLPGIKCRINFTLHEEEASTLSNGQCWHNMFRNPVVVAGYPILRRPNLDAGHGLEIPLNMMAGLAQTQYIQIFNEKLFIKGLSTLLLPTKKDGDVLIWHLLYNEDGNRISYLDNTVPHAEGLSVSELETMRHVLGWCLKANYYAGAADASYKIKDSRLPGPPGNGYALKGIHIQGRRLIRGGPRYSVGVKDTPFHISREDPIQRLRWLDRKFFVLWDEEDKRGWLVNGTSTLLHLLRRSLDDNSDSADKFRFEFCFKKELMQEAPVTHKTFSAIRVLRNDKNLKQEIYPKTKGYFRVENRLDELFDVLEKIIEHQISITKRGQRSNLTGQSGVETASKNKPREYLEGWDFNDLATGEDPIDPRVAIFRKPSGGWVDFARTIHAVTLFGRGFGEIIKPESASCTQWAKLPKEAYYLAAAVDDLKDIMKKNGDQYANPMKLTDDIVWHTPRAMFEGCKCMKNKRKGKHSDLIQVTLPAKLCGILPSEVPIRLSNGGAVIFGNSEKLKGLLKDSEDTKEDETISSADEPDNQSHDSGIGSSLESNFLPSSSPSFTCRDYKVGIVCALPKELLAVRALFDDKHGSECLTSLQGDTNHYSLGHISPHNVVAACLPSGEYGTNAAARVYSHMERSFPHLKICLLVGIGGGVPSKNIRLGDVVISHPGQNYPGVIQYDLGRNHDNDVFEYLGSLQRPPPFIMTAISNLKSDPDIPAQPLKPYLEDIVQKRPEYKYPGREKDPLFTAGCKKSQGHGIACDCPPTQDILGIKHHPEIYYGLIASGNQVMQNAQVRDQLSDKFNVLCFEMEAAGVMNAGNFLVIRGICDYCDSEKNKVWQEYAAAAAAAYAKLLLSKTTIPNDAESLPAEPAVTRPTRKRKQSSEHSNPISSKKLQTRKSPR